MMADASRFRFSSPEGAKLCRQIARDKLDFDPHDYVVEGVCKALDEIDLLAITPTGSGKTSVVIVYMLVVCAILENVGLCPASPDFPKHPLTLMVCPTKSLELDMVC